MPAGRTTGDAPAAAPERRILFGTQVHVVDMDAALSWARARIAARDPAYVVTLNGALLVQAARDAGLRDLVNGAGLVTADGVGVLLAARILGVPLARRVAGIDLTAGLAAEAARAGYRVFLFGSAPGVAEAAAVELRRQHPALQVVGTRHGYFRPDEEPGVLAQIREARPDVLLVALGAPRQEQWMQRWLRDLGVPVAIGVGGSLDVIAGRIPRAPLWMQRLGLEWLYRALREPRRWAVIRTIPPLFAMALRERLKAGRHKPRRAVDTKDVAS
ncbi:MAG: WecB/TagA/CpsF family glycosyltransferase [Armatimonadota bacterium]|nr:WecB/TagA/CpsF family glycosyltransferase [Armatimonadota bacterium]